MLSLPTNSSYITFVPKCKCEISRLPNPCEDKSFPFIFRFQGTDSSMYFRFFLVCLWNFDNRPLPDTRFHSSLVIRFLTIHISAVREEWNIEPLLLFIKKSQLRQFRHVLRMPEDQILRKTLSAVAEGRRSVGRPRHSSEKKIQRLCEERVGLLWGDLSRWWVPNRSRFRRRRSMYNYTKK